MCLELKTKYGSAKQTLKSDISNRSYTDSEWYFEHLLIGYKVICMLSII